ncbi:NAD(P)H-dependent oxidoreductase [Aestuariibaculum sediminum]|uniref:NAD(P)H-dependent oxidoreductase n=1 Tax=Aestuariibaculum sediminum TaxID=2770637 RepID=A0A8J6Q2H1_9FLAO|nr:NAD(P)H-dependent oxidoreductase [Aestuariibaculum sediminum]MBD0832114.1 NAD(P)H-dependent oxidoreductase [Aestuariibaculum sediminum]
MELLEGLNWRYAAKRMTGKKVPQDKLDYILEAARLAPSSSGLQPYEVFVVSNKDLLEQIKPIAWNQPQITECSHLLVFASWDGYSHDKITNVFNEMMDARELPRNTMDEYKETLWGLYEPLDESWHQQHSAKQAYISFAMAIAAAAEQKVDATPIEGFLPEKLDEILSLSEKGLKSAVILALGYRDSENDWNVNLKKYRKDKNKFIHEIK